MKITRISIVSGKETTLELPITFEQMANWRSGMLVQEAFPQLTADQREFMMTGIAPAEWEDYMPKVKKDEMLNSLHQMAGQHCSKCDTEIQPCNSKVCHVLKSREKNSPEYFTHTTLTCSCGATLGEWESDYLMKKER